MNGRVALGAGLAQAVAVAVVSIALAMALPRSFFEDWGWLAGPAAWLGCALLTATVLSLPRGRALLGAALAGIASAVAVIAGIHWLGGAVAVVLFALWCGRIATAAGRAPTLSSPPHPER